MEEGEAEGLPAQDDGETSEWWFYVAGGRMMGPFTPYQMKQSYNAGLIGHQTRVRWLPVCYGKPALVDNSDPENTSALQEICGDGMPPFMDALAPQPSPQSVLQDRVRSRVQRARGSLVRGAVPAPSHGIVPAGVPGLPPCAAPTAAAVKPSLPAMPNRESSEEFGV